MLLSLFKGSANSLSAALCVARSYGDLTCSTIGVAIVIHTVLHVAFDTLDVLFTTTVIIHIVIHFLPSFIWNGISVSKITNLIHYKMKGGIYVDLRNGGSSS